MRWRSACWVGLGALSIACATGTFATPPRVVLEGVTTTEGSTVIGGLVTTSETGEPIPQALLVLNCDCLDGTRETQTNAAGRFAFRDLPPGTYTVLALHGSGEQSRDVPILADQTMRLRFVLSNEPHVRT